MNVNKSFYVLFFWLSPKEPKVQVLAKLLPAKSPPPARCHDFLPAHLRDVCTSRIALAVLDIDNCGKIDRAFIRILMAFSIIAPSATWG